MGGLFGLKLLNDFSAYLQAKFDLDQRSLNRDVWQTLLKTLAATDNLTLLDVGTGTGAMPRRLMQTFANGHFSLTGLDKDQTLLDLAQAEIAETLTQLGFNVEQTRDSLSANNAQSCLEFNTQCNSITLYNTSPSSFHVITAHAFMDLVPLKQTVQQFQTWLKAKGLFYSTLNYDGETVIFPPYDDQSFEEILLAEYDASMEMRRVQDQKTGGAYCGRRLFRCLQQTGFEIIAYGSSDWNITPQNNTYQDNDQRVLSSLLTWIFNEGKQSRKIDEFKLQLWRQTRQWQLSHAELGIIIHQLDLLARKI